MIKATSTVKLNMSAIKLLEKAQITALEQTAEYVHTETVPKVPFDCPTEQEQRNGRVGGTLSGEAFFADYSRSKHGEVQLINSTPYARRLYFHPEYHFDKGEHPEAQAGWLKDFAEGGSRQKEAQKVFAQIYKRVTGV